MSNYDKETEAIKAFWDGSTTIDEQAERIAELEAENAHLRRYRDNYAMGVDPIEYADLQYRAEGQIDALTAQLEAARLLLVAIDENLYMDVNPLTYTTRRIVELLRDPASNPWAALMRAGKEGGDNA